MTDYSELWEAAKLATAEGWTAASVVDSKDNARYVAAASPDVILALLADLDALASQKNPRCQRSMWYEDGHESCTGSDALGCGCPCHAYYLSRLLQKATDAARKADARYETLAKTWRGSAGTIFAGTKKPVSLPDIKAWHELLGRQTARAWCADDLDAARTEAGG